MRAPRHAPQLVSVIIPARNAGTTIDRQLEALADQKHAPEYEVVVVDNGSTDNTATVTASFSSRIARLRVLAASGAPGINRARNAGAHAARGDLLAFCDADDQVTPTWIAELAAAAPDADILGGRLDVEQLNSPAHQLWRPPPPPDRLPVALGFLPYPIGANLAVWADAYRSLGGFDERFDIGATEIEFAWRAQLHGYRLAFAPRAVVAYRYPTTRRHHIRQNYRWGRADGRLRRTFTDRRLPARRPGLGTAARDALGDATRSPLDHGARARTIRRAAYLAGLIASVTVDRFGQTSWPHAPYAHPSRQSIGTST
jgi:glycosyltransferase involved in cell wall biosynthesis